MRKSLIGLVFLVGGLFLTEFADAAPAAVHEPKPLNAKQLAQLLRKESKTIKLVNIWATWCPPCVKEFPDIVKLAQEAGPAVKLIFINFDGPSELAEVKTFLTAQKINFMTYRQGGNDQEFIKGVNNQLDWRQWSQAQWSGALPATFIFDGEGGLHYFWEGELPLAECKTKLNEILSSVKKH